MDGGGGGGEEKEEEEKGVSAGIFLEPPHLQDFYPQISDSGFSGFSPGLSKLRELEKLSLYFGKLRDVSGREMHTRLAERGKEKEEEEEDMAWHFKNTEEEEEEEGGS